MFKVMSVGCRFHFIYLGSWAHLVFLLYFLSMGISLLQYTTYRCISVFQIVFFVFIRFFLLLLTKSGTRTNHFVAPPSRPKYVCLVLILPYKYVLVNYIHTHTHVLNNFLLFICYAFVLHTYININVNLHAYTIYIYKICMARTHFYKYIYRNVYTYLPYI